MYTTSNAPNLLCVMKINQFSLRWLSPASLSALNFFLFMILWNIYLYELKIWNKNRGSSYSFLSYRNKKFPWEQVENQYKKWLDYRGKMYPSPLQMLILCDFVTRFSYIQHKIYTHTAFQKWTKIRGSPYSFSHYGHLNVQKWYFSHFINGGIFPIS